MFTQRIQPVQNMPFIAILSAHELYNSPATFNVHHTPLTQTREECVQAVLALILDECVGDTSYFIEHTVRPLHLPQFAHLFPDPQDLDDEDAVGDIPQPWENLSIPDTVRGMKQTVLSEHDLTRLLDAFYSEDYAYILKIVEV